MKYSKMFFVWAALLLLGGLFAASPAMVIVLMNRAPPVYYGGRNVQTPQVPPGGVLKIDIDSEIKDGCTAKVFRAIVDSTGVATEFEPMARNNIPAQVIELTVPLGAAPGTAYYRARIEWSCNFVQKVFPYVVNQRPLKFEIVPAFNQEQRPEQQGVYEPLIK